jgi:hypothetical protein
LTLHFTGSMQRYPATLLVKLLCWLHKFCSVECQWFTTTEETECL